MSENGDAALWQIARILGDNTTVNVLDTAVRIADALERIAAAMEAGRDDPDAWEYTVMYARLPDVIADLALDGWTVFAYGLDEPETVILRRPRKGDD